MSNMKPSSDRSLSGSVWSSGSGGEKKRASASQKDDSEKSDHPGGRATQILSHGGGVDIEQHRKMMSQILTYVLGCLQPIT